MNANLLNILQKIKEEYGEQVLSEAGRINSFLSDLAQEEPKPQKNAFLKCLDHGFVQIIKNVSETDRAHCKQQLVQRLEEEEGYGSDLCIETLDLLEMVLFGKNSTLPVTSETAQTPKVGSIIPFGDYGWRVLDVQNGKALILSEKIIEKRGYHEVSASPTWEKCSLRYYLNETLCNKFNTSDKTRIAETRVTNRANPWYKTDGGSNTNDRIFLLSLEEVVKYFGDSGQLAKRPHVQNFPGSSYWVDVYDINDQYNSARITIDETGTALCWWLRSPGESAGRAAFVKDDGVIGVTGRMVNYVSDGMAGVRPALWLNL